MPPSIPNVALSAEALLEFRAEIIAEFEAYFASVTGYFSCVDRERGTILGEAQSAANLYSRFLANDLPDGGD